MAVGFIYGCWGLLMPLGGSERFSNGFPRSTLGPPPLAPRPRPFPVGFWGRLGASGGLRMSRSRMLVGNGLGDGRAPDAGCPPGPARSSSACKRRDAHRRQGCRRCGGIHGCWESSVWQEALTCGFLRIRTKPLSSSCSSEPSAIVTFMCPVLRLRSVPVCGLIFVPRIELFTGEAA